MITVVFYLFALANTQPIKDQFETWKQTHGKVYDSPKEELKRMEIFMNNVKYIEEFNSHKNRTMTLGLNQFADMTNEEFLSTMTGSIDVTQELQAWLEKNGELHETPANFVAPDSIDWRKKGAVTRVKDQGQCGSCYSFSTTGSIEGQWFIKTGSLISLSEQQILDCSAGLVNRGCQGGFVEWSFHYVKTSGGIEKENTYPYNATRGFCRFKPDNVKATVSGFKTVDPSEADLKKAVAQVGPISVAIDVDLRFQFYKSGIFYDGRCSSTVLNHAVLVVGYGSNRHGDYWIVKNSWGKYWGEDGYVRMARNYGNMCGIATTASYPTV